MQCAEGVVHLTYYIWHFSTFMIFELLISLFLSNLYNTKEALNHGLDRF